MSVTTTPSDDVSIIVNGMSWGGWESVQISRGIETVPASYMLQGTERYPGQPTTVDIPLTAPCQINIGADTVITGYVDTAERSVTPESLRW